MLFWTNSLTVLTAMTVSEAMGGEIFGFHPIRFLLCAGLAVGSWALADKLLMKNLKAQNILADTSDINQHLDDQHISLPEELFERYDFFPDIGAHSSVVVSTLISHVALSNKGLQKVMMYKRYPEDVYDENGEIIHLKGEDMLDENDENITEIRPMIDEKLMKELYYASGLKRDDLHKYYDPTKIEYSTKWNKKQGGNYKTLAELINNDWELPDYETQTPSGAYIVDTSPVNTMLLAITRAGKGQTQIEPTLDMWTREKRKSNIVINDPKGELAQKFYVRAVKRGYEVNMFNLIFPDKTDIYNPLIACAEEAVQGNINICSQLVDSLGNVFFPKEQGEEPVWSESANNAFKRMAMGSIDYYMEEERALRKKALETNMDSRLLDTKVDQLWGHVTLYNCYQMFLTLSSQVKQNASTEILVTAETEDFKKLSDKERSILMQKAEKQAKFWKGKKEMDLLSLYFNVIEELPRNDFRQKLMELHQSLETMSSAEKMLSSIYGICITSMSFFSEPTIKKMTSGSPSQNVDLNTLDFPRMVAVRFIPEVLKKKSYIRKGVRWSAYEDNHFKKRMGKEFNHEDIIDSNGWAYYYFDGIFPEDKAYLKCEVFSMERNQVIKTYYFEFEKSYRLSMDGKRYVKDPILGEEIVLNGTLRELIPSTVTKEFTCVPGHYEVEKEKIIDPTVEEPKIQRVKVNAIRQTRVRYTERPKMIFMNTPPNQMRYAKLILIMLKQLTDKNFEEAYKVKDTQKPLYNTRFMLDELGNLQSNKQGIEGLGTDLSIGLGQGQFFYLVLQTLQQLRALYGENQDKIMQGNVGNIIFLKSTDDAMIDTLVKLSGTTHKAYVESQNVTRAEDKLFLKNEGKVSLTKSLKEEPVIKTNDLLFLADKPGNSIVFPSGQPVVWNRNQLTLPMSWRMFKNTITDDGVEYSFKKLPTISEVAYYDANENVPDFVEMLEKRMEQAIYVPKAKEIFQKAHGYTDYDIKRLDRNEYSDEIMNIVDDLIESDNRKLEQFKKAKKIYDFKNGIKKDPEVERAVRESAAKKEEYNQKRFAQGLLSKPDLRTDGRSNRNLDPAFIAAFKQSMGDFREDKNYLVKKNSLFDRTGTVAYICKTKQDQELVNQLNADMKDPKKRVYGEEEMRVEYSVTNEFFIHLAELDSWKQIAHGKFDFYVAKYLREFDLVAKNQ